MEGPTFSMLINKLEGFDEAKSFIDRATDRQVVDAEVTHDTLRRKYQDNIAQLPQQYLNIRIILHNCLNST